MIDKERQIKLIPTDTDLNQQILMINQGNLYLLICIVTYNKTKDQSHGIVVFIGRKTVQYLATI